MPLPGQARRTIRSLHPAGLGKQASARPSPLLDCSQMSRGGAAVTQPRGQPSIAPHCAPQAKGWEATLSVSASGCTPDSPGAATRLRKARHVCGGSAITNGSVIENHPWERFVPASQSWQFQCRNRRAHGLRDSHPAVVYLRSSNRSVPTHTRGRRRTKATRSSPCHKPTS